MALNVPSQKKPNVYDFFQAFSASNRSRLLTKLNLSEQQLQLNDNRPEAIFAQILDILKSSDKVYLLMDFFDPYDPAVLEAQDIDKKTVLLQMFYLTYNRLVTLLKEEQNAILFAIQKRAEELQLLDLQAKSKEAEDHFQHLVASLPNHSGHNLLQPHIHDVTLSYIQQSQMQVKQLNKQINALRKLKTIRIKQMVQQQVSHIQKIPAAKNITTKQCKNVVLNLKTEIYQLKKNPDKDIAKIILEKEKSNNLIKEEMTSEKAKAALDSAFGSANKIPFSPLQFFKRGTKESKAESHRAKFDNLKKISNTIDNSKKSDQPEMKQNGLIDVLYYEAVIDNNIKLNQLPPEQEIELRKEVVNSSELIANEQNSLHQEIKQIKQQREVIKNNVNQTCDAYKKTHFASSQDLMAAQNEFNGQPSSKNKPSLPPKLSQQ